MNDFHPASTPQSVRILLVDDDPIVLESLGSFLEMEGYQVAQSETVSDACSQLDEHPFNLVITDVQMPASDGMELLRHCRRRHPDVVVIIITGYGTIESAVEAMKQGAFEYLTKPIIDDDVRIAVRRALAQQELIAENRQLKRELTQQYSFENVLGRDHRMARVFEVLSAAADSRATVLITGESGTGKSLIARAIHAQSPMREGPFVEVACGAMPETILESELFGHVKGAFTDAVSDKEGKFAAADGGTIFLDEIGNASPALQIKLLRVLQDQQFEPVGSNTTRQVDCRVVLATNADLRADVEAGRFREDLYYRIHVVSVELPPLRDRDGDVPLLAEHFLHRLAGRNGKQIAGFTAEAMGLLQRYDWPGNVRELENCVERAVVLCRQALIGPDDLPPTLLETRGPSKPDRRKPATDLDLDGRTLEEVLSESERAVITQALESNRGQRQQTAEQLGINRVTLYKKMKKHGLM
ncbi:MAG: sigma-54-dependent transcriptional regulator [Phycisphaerae bacterium]